MTRSSVSTSPPTKNSSRFSNSLLSKKARRRKSQHEKTDVLVSAVISPQLLSHLHHLLQSAESAAIKNGRNAHAINFAQLRKVLCLDARSMKDASAFGLISADSKRSYDSELGPKVA